MPPKISIVRHAQGFHNKTRDYTIHDPLLTPEGKQQCAHLSSVFPHHATADLVVASPLRRTVQTASYSFGPTLKRDEVPFLVLPVLQEVSDSGADTGTDASLLEKAYEEMFKGEDLGFDPKKIDRSQVTDGWNSKTGYYEYDFEKLSKRGHDFRKWAFQRPESHIIVVSHGAIAHFLTEDCISEIPMGQTTYRNCELRDFVFTPESTAEKPDLVETEECKERRRGQPKKTDAHVVEEVRGSLHGEEVKVAA